MRKTKSDASLVTNMNKYALLLVLFVSLVDSPCGPVCSEYLYLPLLLKPFMLMKWNQPLKTLENLQCKKYSYLVLTFKANESTMRGCTKIVKASYRAFKALLARLIPKKEPKPKEKIFWGVPKTYFNVNCSGSVLFLIYLQLNHTNPTFGKTGRTPHLVVLTRPLQLCSNPKTKIYLLSQKGGCQILFGGFCSLKGYPSPP